MSFAGSFGVSQFAYRKYHGARDAVLYVVLIWLLAFGQGRKVATYCSDVVSAFDRVSFEKLMAKIRKSVIHEDLVRVIEDWLTGRKGQVIIEGVSSESFDLENMTFQGTVWGPALWNLFFSDAPLAMRKCAFKEVVFADDLNAYREFANGTPAEFVLEQLHRCQDELHQWGLANSVTFDSKKESFHILSHTESFGSSFKLLGVTLDVQLTMAEATQECSVEAHWRLSFLLVHASFSSLEILCFIISFKSSLF